jgi:hypothetical protein
MHSNAALKISLLSLVTLENTVERAIGGAALPGQVPSDLKQSQPISSNSKQS